MFVDASQSEIEKEQYVGGIDTDCVKEEVCVIQWCLCTLVLGTGTGYPSQTVPPGGAVVVQ